MFEIGQEKRIAGRLPTSERLHTPPLESGDDAGTRGQDGPIVPDKAPLVWGQVPLSEKEQMSQHIREGSGSWAAQFEARVGLRGRKRFPKTQESLVLLRPKLGDIKPGAVQRQDSLQLVDVRHFTPRHHVMVARKTWRESAIWRWRRPHATPKRAYKVDVEQAPGRGAESESHA